MKINEHTNLLCLTNSSRASDDCIPEIVFARTIAYLFNCHLSYQLRTPRPSPVFHRRRFITKFTSCLRWKKKTYAYLFEPEIMKILAMKYCFVRFLDFFKMLFGVFTGKNDFVGIHFHYFATRIYFIDLHYLLVDKKKKNFIDNVAQKYLA